MVTRLAHLVHNSVFRNIAVLHFYTELEDALFEAELSTVLHLYTGLEDALLDADICNN